MLTVPVLCYHKVGSEEKFGRRLNIEPSRLESHFAFFQRRGFRFLKGADFREPLSSRCVAFTFDDAFECTVAETNRIFRSLETPLTHFAVVERVGATSDWPGENSFTLASWDQLHEAARLGHEIGNHTLTHARLAESIDTEIRKQVVHAERLLRMRGLGGSFCYPYGSNDARTRSVVSQLDVPIAMSLLKGLTREDSNRLLLPRITIAFSDALPMLIYKVFVRNRLRKTPQIVLEF